MNCSNCSNRCPSSGFAGIPAFDPADGVLDLADDEVQFQGGRRRARALQDRREHVEPAFGEGLEVVFGVLAPSGGL